MATTKPKTTKKATVTKKTPARKPAAKKSVTNQAKTTELRSFKRAPQDRPFMTFKVTRDTLYWLIISVLVFALGSWVMYLNVKIQRIYDQVELNTSIYESYDFVPKEKTTPKE